MSFIHAGYFIAQDQWTHPNRIIDNIELIIGVNGVAYVQENKTRYEVNTNTSLILLPGQQHSGHESSKPSFYWLHFLPREDYKILDEREGQNELIYLSSNSPYKDKMDNIVVPLYFQPPAAERLAIIFHQLLHVANAEYYTSEACNFLLTSLLIELSQQAINSYIITHGNDASRRFSYLLAWIRTNTIRDISVKEIADEFGYNRDYLSRLFREKINMTVVEYINYTRIEKAKKLLFETEDTIKEIAYAVGFSDDKYFMKLFKRYEFMTPSEYRNAFSKTYISII